MNENIRFEENNVVIDKELFIKLINLGALESHIEKNAEQNIITEDNKASDHQSVSTNPYIESSEATHRNVYYHNSPNSGSPNNVKESYLLDQIYFSNLRGINTNELRKKISEVLRSLMISTHLKGYRYLRDAILLVVQNENFLSGITKIIYPALADKYDSTPLRVERTIRYAIDNCAEKDINTNFDDIFKTKGYSKNCKPSNSEFIAVIAEKIRLEDNRI